MTIRTYVRRSKNDDGKQQFSLDVQRAGCREFVKNAQFGARPLVEYVDDGKSGDDFHSRAGLRKLIADTKAGDVVVCRDQSRLGRDAIEVTLVVRDLVRDRGCRLFYYVNGQQVQFANAIDQATTFIQGTGHQMELEAIRSRTREALRSRVLAGRIAGGRCFGYQLERCRDAGGRSYTVAIVDPEQAKIVVRIFEEYLAGYGLKAIAHRLNSDRIPSPMAGRRGTGSWSPGAVRVVLLNARYRGQYIHGKVKRVRRAGVSERVKADQSDVMTVEVPEWRIIDDATWCRVQETFAERAAPSRQRTPGPACRYALSGIARCSSCGGPAYVTLSRHGNESFKAYGCGWRHTRGAAVCPVTIHQRTDEVEGTIIRGIQEEILTPAMLAFVLNEIRQQFEEQMPQTAATIEALEEEVRSLRAEQKQLAAAVATARDVPELIDELRRRSVRLRAVEVELAAAKRTPNEIAALMARVEASASARVADLRKALSRPADLRQALLVLFPEGIKLIPDEVGARQVWKIEARPDLGALAGSSSNCVVTPAGIEPAFSA